MSLRPGESRLVSFRLSPGDVAVWNTGAGHWTTVPGRYGLFVGTSSRDLLPAGTWSIG